MTSADGQPGTLRRWNDYALGYGGEADALLCAAAELNPPVLIMGDGFDPRTLNTLKRLVLLGICPRVVCIPLPRGLGTGASSVLARRNREGLAEIVSGTRVEIRHVVQPEGIDRLTVGSRVSRELVESGAIKSGDTVIVDISALPSRLYFPLIGTFLALGERDGEGELLVTVWENPVLDEKIRAVGADDAGPITGFAHGFSADADRDQVRIWAPVLGEQQGPELEAIHALLQPQEVYPVLPFPAANPRRGDDLVLEYRTLLFDQFDVRPRDILYVQENNPFDTYRALTGLNDRYRRTLAPLGEPLLITSIHGSKMLSVGVCLAAWESKLPVVTAGPSGYTLAEELELEWVVQTSTLACMWLHGLPYR